MTDTGIAIPLLRAVPPRRWIIAEVAHHADSLACLTPGGHIQAVVLSTVNRIIPHPLGRKVCGRSNLTSRLFCRLENRRRIATRHGRLAQNAPPATAPVVTTSARS